LADIAAITTVENLPNEVNYYINVYLAQNFPGSDLTFISAGPLQSQGNQDTYTILISGTTTLSSSQTTDLENYFANLIAYLLNIDVGRVSCIVSTTTKRVPGYQAVVTINQADPVTAGSTPATFPASTPATMPSSASSVAYQFVLLLVALFFMF